MDFDRHPKIKYKFKITFRLLKIVFEYFWNTKGQSDRVNHDAKQR